METTIATTVSSLTEQVSDAVSGAMIALIVAGAAILLLVIILLVWFIYEMMSINKNTRETAEAVKYLASQQKIQSIRNNPNDNSLDLDDDFSLK